jgi:hypothetical protein
MNHHFLFEFLECKLGMIGGSVEHLSEEIDSVFGVMAKTR